MNIYKGVASGKCDNESLVDFLNYVFGMNGDKASFYKLLPKLYKPEYHPEDYNYIAMEDGRLRASVGAYPFALKVSGETLRGIGIGNVAVHPMHRSKGYMIDCMKLALDEAIKNGADFAALGGKRQRYSYFGFEPAGVCGAFILYNHNLKHVYGSINADTGFTAKEISATDSAELEKIKALSSSRDYSPARDNANYFDIISSWNSKVYVVNDKAGEFAGYFIYGGDEGAFNVMEIDCTKEENAVPVLRTCFEVIGGESISLDIPEINKAFYDLLSDIAEGVTLSNTEHFCVYNYKKVMSATFKLKAGYTKLCDGEFSVEIDGMAGKEKLLISVKNGVPSVSAYEGDCDLKFTHRQAMGVFFGLAVPEKKLLPPCVAGWFPLPLNTYGVDNC